MAGFGEQKKKKNSTPQGNAQIGGEVLHKTAVENHMRGDLVNAEKAYRAAIKTGYLHSATFSNLGVICKISGRSEEAIFLYEKAIEISHDNPDAYANLGNLFRELGRFDPAIASTLKSLDLKPDNPTALMNLGWIYKELGQLDQALDSTLKSLDLKPDNPTAHMNLGGIYKELGQLDQALASTLKSLELLPDHPTALMNLGWIYKGLGQLDQALDSTLKSLELLPDHPTALMNLGGIYKELGQLDQALDSTLKSLDLKPDNPTAHMNLGWIYKQLSDYTNAEKEADLAIKMNASKSDICKRLKAACLFHKQAYDEAIELLKGLKAEIIHTEKSSWETEIALRSTIYAKKHKFLKVQLPEATAGLKEGEGMKSLVIKKSRPVEKNLIEELQEVDSKGLMQTIDARNGDGYCTNFQLFNSKLPAIQQLSKDLHNIASESLGMDIPSIKHDSFFNIFNKGAGTIPHSHIKIQDHDFDKWKHKFSLVYYLDPGDQDGEHPGILQMHDPDIQILPTKGMIVIIPATRVHSSYYEGTKSRLMVGVNFYAFHGNLD